MLVWWPFMARNAGVRVVGAIPQWVFWASLEPGGPTPLSLPPIREIGHGQYAFQYDSDGGDMAGQIDLGPTVPAESDRYVDVSATREISRILDAPSSGWIVGG